MQVYAVANEPAGESPGHSTDSICILAAAPGETARLITGDTLFVGKVGGTGYGADARAEYDSLHKKLMTLPDETEVWPGHDYGVAPSSTIGNEKETNPFLRCDQADLQASLRSQGKLEGETTADVFTTVRGWKDNF